MAFLEGWHIVPPQKKHSGYIQKPRAIRVNILPDLFQSKKAMAFQSMYFLESFKKVDF